MGLMCQHWKNMEECPECIAAEQDKPGPINPADFATTPVMHLRVTLAEVTRAVIDLEDTKDRLTKAIADLNERAESIRNEIKRLK